MSKARTMAGGRHFKVIREGRGGWDCSIVVRGDEISLSGALFDTFEDVQARGRREGEFAMLAWLLAQPGRGPNNVTNHGKLLAQYQADRKAGGEV